MPRTGENIYLRSDGRYEGRYIASRDENGRARYKSVYGQSKEEVRAKLAEARAALAREQAGVVTFRQAYEAWLGQRREQVSAATADRYEYLLEKFILPELGGKAVDDITPAQAGAFVASLADAGEHGGRAVSGPVAATLLEFVSSILASAGGEHAQAAAFRRRMGAGSGRGHFEPLSPDEIRRVITCAWHNRSPEMLGVLLTLYTGIGTGELCALSWDDIDRGRRELYISRTLYRLKDRDGGGKKTRLAVTGVAAGNVRTAPYPEELSPYVEEFYREGTVFLTCEGGRYMEQRVLCSHLGRAFSLYGLAGLTLKRVHKTFKEGLADIRYLRDPFFLPGDRPPGTAGVNEKWLLKEMENDLGPLRRILGLSGEEMGQVLGVPGEEYLAMESGEVPLGWDRFLALLFFFRYNAKTEGVVDALGLYPEALRERLSIGGAR